MISGNAFGGVAIGTGAYPGPDGTNNNHVEGNLIGCNLAATEVVGVQISGVTVEAKGKGNVIRKNVIVGQVNHGIVFSDATNNAMYGNWIGTTRRGALLANAGFGAYLVNSSNTSCSFRAPPPGRAMSATCLVRISSALSASTESPSTT